MLPIVDIVPDSDTSVLFSMWECHNCPSTVKQYADDDYWFSIITFYGGHWYEVMQMYVPPEEHKEPPLLSIYKYTVYKNSQNQPSVRSELAMEFSIDAQITPQNINQKLATILTFS